jgi:hypothetical protein
MQEVYQLIKPELDNPSTRISHEFIVEIAEEPYLLVAVFLVQIRVSSPLVQPCFQNFCLFQQNRPV